ncbi:MAG: HAD family hydrolase [Alphaproteobacteria bacterium]|nr:HAD family hydrolase [Alphaproteobacteria bacterium]
MAPPPRLAMFDCDGTLVDSQQAIVAAMVAACAAFDLPVPSTTSILRVVGLPIEAGLAALLPEHGPRMHGRVIDFFRARARERHGLREQSDEPLYPGVVAVLEALGEAGVLLGIATGKPRRGLLATLDRHTLGHHFVTLKTADDGPGKPNPDILLAAMAEVGVAAENTVMIGDTSFDMAMARSAGTHALGVAWGYHPSDELVAAGASHVVETGGGLLLVARQLLRIGVVE